MSPFTEHLPKFSPLARLGIVVGLCFVVGGLLAFRDRPAPWAPMVQRHVTWDRPDVMPDQYLLCIDGWCRPIHPILTEDTGGPILKETFQVRVGFHKIGVKSCDRTMGCSAEAALETVIDPKGDDRVIHDRP
jgi:hypothetical protein